MANRTSPLHEATRQARWNLLQLGRELRLARITGGMTQASVACTLGTSQSRVSEVEQGHVRALSVIWASRHAAAVGLRLYLRSYPGGRRLLDAPQRKLLERLRARISAVWRWELEVPIPREGDLRAADARLTGAGSTILVEAITRLADLQAQVRAAQLKRRDVAADRLLLLVGASSANREAMRAAALLVREAFPLGTRETLAALADGRDPGADAVIVI